MNHRIFIIIALFLFVHTSIHAQKNGICITGNCENGIGTFFYSSDSSRYEGNWKEGKKEGKGTFLWLNGNKYTGSFYNDMRNGKGVFQWANGDRYEGDFLDDYRTGVGIYHFKSGNVFDGQWLKGNENGHGIMKTEEGIFEGTYIDDKRNGSGIYTDTAGVVIRGFWKDDIRVKTDTVYNLYAGKFTGSKLNGKKSGPGKFYLPNGNIVEATFKSDTIFCCSKMRFSDGRMYEGPLKKYKANGNGTLYFSSGVYYEGHFVNDTIQGIGTLHFKNGDVYTGEWKNDLRNGKGTYIYKDGEILVDEGQFENGFFTGQGIRKYKSGNILEGKFANDKAEGYAVFTWKDGQKYEGYFKNGIRNGRGKYTFLDKRVYDGEWVNNSQEGYGKFYNERGILEYEGLWKNGDRVAKAETNATVNLNTGSVFLILCAYKTYGIISNGATYNGRNGNIMENYTENDGYEIKYAIAVCKKRQCTKEGIKKEMSNVINSAIKYEIQEFTDIDLNQYYFFDVNDLLKKRIPNLSRYKFLGAQLID